MANEVAMKFSDRLAANLQLPSVHDALPKDFNEARFRNNCVAVLNDKSADFANVNQASIIAGFTKGAFLGLDFFSKECYLVPFGKTAQFLTSYSGDVKLIKKYSIRPIKDVYSKVVREDDFLDARIEDNKHLITFRPKLFSNAPIVGFFAYIEYEDGGIDYEAMSKEEVDNVRNNYSKMKNSKPWTASYDEMGRKTVLKRLCKHVNIDFESVEARKAWDEADGNDFEGNMKRTRHDDVQNAFTEEPYIDSEATIVEEADEVFGA